MKRNKLDRRLELSSKFIEMGQALILEGQKDDDYSIAQCGNFMFLIGGLIMKEEDVFEFGNLCSMFSAKKILESIENGESDLKDYMNGSSYEEIMKIMNKLKGGNGLPPTGE